jgi:hypothetical protein
LCLGDEIVVVNNPLVEVLTIVSHFCCCCDEYTEDETIVELPPKEDLQHQFHRRDVLARNSFVAGIFIGSGYFPWGNKNPTIPTSYANPPLSQVDDTMYIPTNSENVMLTAADICENGGGGGGVPFQKLFPTVCRYKSITLFKGMTVLLVTDKNACLSSAALTIRDAGKFSDPPIL